MGNMDDSAPLGFQGFELHPDTLELRRNGELLDLTPAPARALVFLARHAGRLVGREELYEHLWPEGGVDVDRALNTYIRQIRRALGERGGEDRFIRTHPGRGYRFVARMEPSVPKTPEAEVQEGRAVEGPQGRRRRRIAAVAAVTGIGLLAIYAALSNPGAGPGTGHIPPLDSARRLAYLTGVELLHQTDPSSRARAAAQFRLVTSARPDFAPAHSGLAESLIWGGDMAAAAAAARTAVALDPDDPRAHRALGTTLLVVDWAWEEGEEHLRRAVALDGTDAESHVALAYLLVSAGRRDEAEASLDRAAALDPVSPVVTGDIGTLYGWIAEHEKALELCRRTVEVDPAARWGHRCVEQAEVALGLRQDVKPAEAAPDEDPATLPTHHARAAALVRAGRLEAALDELGRSAEARELGFVAIRAIPALAPLRGRPGFERLAARLFGEA